MDSRKQRISYFPPERMDAQMQSEMDRCRREGTPRPESSAVRAHVPAAFWSFANSWRDLFRNELLQLGRAQGDSVLQHNESFGNLSCPLVLLADHCRIGNQGVRENHPFQLGWHDLKTFELRAGVD